NATRELLLFSPGRVKEVLVVEDRENKRLKEIVELALKQDIKLSKASKHELSQIVRSDSHQGIVAKVDAREGFSLKSLLGSKRSDEAGLLLLIDAVQDPHNLGAILRAAECYGVQGVIYSRNRCPGIGPVVRKSSSGASEIVPVVEVGNLVQAAVTIKKAEYWLVGADVGEGSESLHKFSFPARCCLVLGSEGSGIQRLLLEKLDYRVKIPMFGRLDSLNVSQAASVFLDAYRRGLCSIDKQA
ncbi:MAG: 23S rRNA (guanosine(2251)-2'-O)-methyltransferase RlmB, partial [Bdellovibrionales bacterium]|nr:23S rRNA (guanosine(2251)-2'-O)-methyltransferase RlmB [Bdellovibrionales bacterium]